MNSFVGTRAGSFAHRHTYTPRHSNTILERARQVCAQSSTLEDNRKSSGLHAKYPNVHQQDTTGGTRTLILSARFQYPKRSERIFQLILRVD